MKENIYGRIHSVETLGAVDGPGIRVVIFVQGCRLRCLYCHNPDSWKLAGGKLTSAKEVVNTVLSYSPFIENGGVTISGGEPLLQPDFVAEVLRLCKNEGIHTAVDTAGSVDLQIAKKVIDLSDMLLLDIKDLNEQDSIKLCGISPTNCLETLNYCEKIHKRVWIRHVLVPGLTLQTTKLENLASYLEAFTCVELVELLPFHKLGEYKWHDLNFNYQLENVQPPTEDDLKKAALIFKLHGIKTH